MKKLLLLACLFLIPFAIGGTTQIMIQRSPSSYPDTNTYYCAIMGCSEQSPYTIIETEENIIPTSGTITYLYVELTAAPNSCGGCPANSRRRNRIYKNGAETAAQCNTIGSAITCTWSGSVTVAEGDRLAFGSEPDVGQTAATEIFTSISFTPDTDDETMLLGGTTITDTNNTGFLSAHGRKNAGETDYRDAATLIMGDFNITELWAYRTKTGLYGYTDFNLVNTNGTLLSGCRISASDQQCMIAFNPEIPVTDFNRIAVKETYSGAQKAVTQIAIELKALDTNTFIIASSQDTTLPTNEANYYFWMQSMGDGTTVDTNTEGATKARLEVLQRVYSSEITLDKFGASIDTTPGANNDFNFSLWTTSSDPKIFCDIVPASPGGNCSDTTDLEWDNNNIFYATKFTKGGFSTPTVNGARTTALFKATPIVDLCVGVCTYSSGVFIVPCGCNCDLNESIDLSGNTLWIDDSQGGGTTIISKDINNVGDFTVTGTSFCTLKGLQHIIKVK